MKDITLLSFLIKVYNKDTIPNEKTTSLGPLYLLSALENKGFNVDFRDYQFSDRRPLLDLNNIYSFFDNSSRFIAISCMSDTLPFIIQVVKKIKEVYPEKIVILGGPGPTATAETILLRFPFIDFAIKGEGEISLPQLLQCLKSKSNLDKVSGLVYRDNGSIVSLPQRRIENLDSLAPPAYNRIKLQDYAYYCISSRRGCPFKCTFCSIPKTWEGKTVYRDNDNVIEEIKYIYKNSKNKRIKIGITDDLFILNKKRAIEFCNKLKKESLDIDWWVFGKIELVDMELIEIMSKSGCRGIFYGIESGSDRVLKKIGKNFTIDQACRVIFDTKKYIKEITASFIYGFPFESLDDFHQTLLTICRLHNSGVICQMHLATPFPLTCLYNQYKNRLKFSTKIIPDLAWEASHGNMPFEIINMIKNYPDIFPNFYHFYSKDILKKKKKVDKFFNAKRK